MGLLSTALSSLGVGPLLAGVGVAAALGAAGAEIYEHTVPWGLGPKMERLRDSIPGKVAKAHSEGLRDQLEADRESFRKWDTALGQCNKLRKEESEAAAVQLTAAKKTFTSSRTAAYELGRASCGVPDAKPPPGVSPSAVGVRNNEDLRTILAPAAYAPAAR